MAISANTIVIGGKQFTASVREAPQASVKVEQVKVEEPETYVDQPDPAPKSDFILKSSSLFHRDMID